jgi:SAM-dependent methyltransferase
VPVRIEEILERIRREIAAESAGAAADDRTAAAEDDSLPAISSRAELEYLNRNWALFDPLSEMRSHRRLLGPVVLRFKWRLRRLVLGVLDRYFEKERLFLLELVRFTNALAGRSDRLLQELTERTKAVAERNDLFLGALDLRLEALEARDRMRAALAAPPAAVEDDGVLAEMANAFGVGVAERIRASLPLLPRAGRLLVLGCGDGEAFAALEETSLDRSGVEASAELVAAARTRGVPVERAELLPYLESLEEESLGALIVARVADRHGTSAWPRLIAGAWRALRPGGVAVFEGVTGAKAAEKLRWLLARQRFAVVESRAIAGGDSAGVEHVLVGRRGGPP